MASKSELLKNIETQQNKITRLEQRLAGRFLLLFVFFSFEN